MWQKALRSALLVVTVAVAVVAVPGSALASINPTLNLDQSAGNAAGSTADLGVTLKFSPAGGDSPESMTLNLPTGLLANASIDGGACLTTTDLNDSACQVGSGTVTADAYGTIPITTAVTFDLVPPPASGDLAGLAVNSNGTQIGATADIKIRPSGDPNGVGAAITFVLPNSLYGVPISIAQINSTFNGLRYPTTCPSTPQSFSVAVDSYSDPTVHTVTAPLVVTRCSSLAYVPVFSVTAIKDAGDNQVSLTTHVTQGASEAPSSSVTLAFPWPQLAPNLASVGVLCTNLASGKCSPVGSVVASSPLYPKALTGQAFLTGSVGGLTLTLVFPSPFPLTLVGSVNLASNSTTFTGLPDIPLTDLAVSLTGGAKGLFQASCKPPSAIATADLTDQNGDKTVTDRANFTVSGCQAGGGGASGGSGGGGSTGGASNGNGNLSSVSGLGSGRTALSFTMRVARNAAKLRVLTVELPPGLSFVTRRIGGKTVVSGVKLIGAKAKSVKLSRGSLVIVLRRPTSALTIRISSGALHESAALRAQAKSGKLASLLVTVIAQSTKAHRAVFHVRIRNLGR